MVWGTEVKSMNEYMRGKGDSRICYVLQYLTASRVVKVYLFLIEGGEATPYGADI